MHHRVLIMVCFVSALAHAQGLPAVPASCVTPQDVAQHLYSVGVSYCLKQALAVQKQTDTAFVAQCVGDYKTQLASRLAMFKDPHHLQVAEILTRFPDAPPSNTPLVPFR
jgi:glycine cleavage system regulatory protein